MSKKQMSSTKNQSMTTETRLTQSNLVNCTIDKGNSFMAQHIQQAESKQTQFLQIKNRQLLETIRRMAAELTELQNNKLHLLGLNEKYIRVVNEYYRKPKAKTQQSKSFFSPKFSDQPAKKVLHALERDHRNLVKHCLVMEQEILNYTQEMHKFQALKEQLQRANHTSASELIEQLETTTLQNKELKMQNNRLCFELQKSELECRNLKRRKQECKEKAEESTGELEKYRSLAKSIEQQSKDQQNESRAKIYDLEIKIEKLEKELRSNQECVNRHSDLRCKLEMERVENVHECDQLRTDLSHFCPIRRGLTGKKPKHHLTRGLSYVQ